MKHPDNQTSNYGWALWHLGRAALFENARVDSATFHAGMAQARATLALIDAQGGDFHGSTWSGDTTADKP